MLETPVYLWGDQQTTYYGVKSVPCESAHEFFGVTSLREPQWQYPEYGAFPQHDGPETVKQAGAGYSRVRELLNLLKSTQIVNASAPLPSGQTKYMPCEILTNEAVKLILQLLGMECPGRTMVRLHQPVWLHSLGKYHPVILSTAAVDEAFSFSILLCIEDRPYDHSGNPFGQLIAGAIAAFQCNNQTRIKQRAPPLESMLIPGMIWYETVPSFYRIKVTRELAECVSKGLRPTNETILAKFTPKINRLLLCYGMWRMQTRVKVMKYLENMKDFCPQHWNHAPPGWIRFMSEEELVHLTRDSRDLDSDLEMDDA